METSHQVVTGHHGTAEKPIKRHIMMESNQRITIKDCSHVEFTGISIDQLQLPGHPLKGKHFAVDIVNCSHAKIIRPFVRGNPDETDKGEWAKTVPNGIRIERDCSHVEIIKPRVFRCHVGIQDRGFKTTLSEPVVYEISGDHLQILSTSSDVIRPNLRWTIDVLPYSDWHCDLIQIFNPTRGDMQPLQDISISDGLFESWTNPKVHKWCKASQIMLFSDGVGDRLTIEGNTIVTEHDIAVLLNPCTNSKIRNNKIFTVGECQPIIGIEDRKKYGTPCYNNDVSNNTIDKFTGDIDNHSEEIDNLTSDIDNLPEDASNLSLFDREITSLKNRNATAVTDSDYAEAAARLRISMRMIKAVARVESRGFGFNDDGSVKILYERHKAYKFAKDAGINVTNAQRKLGDNIINRQPGGYKGELAEYQRCKDACGLSELINIPDVSMRKVIIKADSNPEFSALDIAIRSCSWGEFQIMGFNYQLAGFNSPLEMVQAFHRSQVEHLNAFCSFLENTGLIQHLREAERLIEAGKSPRPALNLFANGYNGKKHNGYDVKIAAEYRRLSDEPADFKPLRKSRTIQGGTAAIIGSTGAIAGVSELSKVISDMREMRESIVETRETLTGDLEAIRTDLKNDIDRGDLIIWLVVAALIITNLGAIRAIWARVTDRLTGRN